MMNRIATRPSSCSCKKKCVALLARRTNISIMAASRRLSDDFGLKSHILFLSTTTMKFKRLYFCTKYEHVSYAMGHIYLYIYTSVGVLYRTRK